MGLKVRDVDAYYGSKKVLASIDFNAAHGEFLGIIGPNGSGKTTLLRTISRILRPRKGTILLDERAIEELNERDFACKFALVPQETAINFEFSALDIVLMGRNPHLGRWELESQKDIEIAKRCMELTNCWHLADRRITELSGGEKQLVLIARALAQEPEVLLLDEPTSHLDINYQIEIMELLKRLTMQEGLIVIAVIHDLNLAAHYCDRLVLLHRGRVVSIGTPESVLNPDNIKDTFGADVIVWRYAVTNHYYVSPVPVQNRYNDRDKDRERDSDSDRGTRIHLICGGGAGASLMHTLTERGYKVTVGVVNMLDTDCEVAQHLGIPVVTEAPFSPIADKALHELMVMIQDADAVIVCDMPVGFGNLRNLEAAKRASELGKPVLIFDGIEERDFTGGEATKLFVGLKSRGAIVVKDKEELFNKLEFIVGGRGIRSSNSNYNCN
ncbi:MAG: heme ABC transporter ATP-binding protein [Candidatus Methanophagaceae archaeon]|nr:MAG: heme ABC transporter ATP-binding protein [Methanophagales archaeon]